MEDKITNVEGALLDVAIMVAPDTPLGTLLIGRGWHSSFFESIDVNSSAVFGDAFVVVLHCW
jgi:hypothetical protein